MRRKRTDFQWLYMVALQKRLRKELKSTGPLQVNGLERKWLIEWLGIHDWNIPWYCAAHICKLLEMDAKQISLPAYYCDVKVKVWLPEKQHGIEAMPPCPCCASNKEVVRHGCPDTHVAREYIGLEKKKYVMGARYKCHKCYRDRKEHTFIVARSGVQVT